MAFSPRKIVWKFFELLPNNIKHRLIRNSVDIDESKISGIEIRVAKNQNEINQAFKLLYDSYVTSGLMDVKDHEIRVTKYHCLPTSIIIVALLDGEVIGTITHILDSQLGLPSDSAVDLSSFRKNGKRISEVSALAINKKYRRSQVILYAMIRYMYFYASIYAGVDYFIIGVRSNVASYYEALFFYKRFKTKKIAHQFVKNSPSYFLYAKVDDLEKLFLKHYSKKPANKNLYNFFLQKQLKEIGSFEQFKYSIPLNYCYDKTSFADYFRKKELIIDSLSEKEKLEVLNAYKDFYPNFFDFNEVTLLARKNIRKSVRYIANYKINILKNIVSTDSSITLNKEFITSGVMLNFSRSGFILKTKQKLIVDTVYIIRFAEKNPIERMISFKVIKDLKNDLYCGIVSNNPKAWDQFITEMEQFFYTQTSSEDEVTIRNAG